MRQRRSVTGGWRRCAALIGDGHPPALFAAVGYIRAATSRAGVPVRQACQDLAGRPGYPAP
jgi:hypothetical protein